jgi:predicted metal-dependent HD superfamily phosphohydrolase/alkylhydroperoxidase family enzyme
VAARQRISPGGLRQLGPINFTISRIGGRVVGAEHLNLFSTLGRGKRLFLGWLGYSGLLMPFGALRRSESETVILRVAHLRGSEYELIHHRRIGVRAGLTERQLELVFGGAGWDERSAALLAVVTELVESRSVSDGAWSALARHYDDRRLVEIVLLTTQYDGLATTIDTLGIVPERRTSGPSGDPECPACDFLDADQRAQLLGRWSEPHRHYHDRRHLAAVLRALDELAAAGAVFEREPVELAAWFHDAVYEIGAPDNEERSARLAEAMLTDRPTVAAETARLVRVTVGHEVADGDVNAGALCDADLAVLAGSPDRYQRYADAVRAEYRDVPDAVFRPARAKVLADLLAHSQLFHTAAGRTRWEAAARANVAAEIERLTAIG